MFWRTIMLAAAPRERGRARGPTAPCPRNGKTTSQNAGLWWKLDDMFLFRTFLFLP